MMRVLIIACVLLLLPACSWLTTTPEEDTRSLFDRLEFKPDQTGCIRANGSVKVGGNPFAQSEINISMVKKQGDDAPDC
jgi:hypothetical protein